jgi:hypothetical protein
MTRSVMDPLCVGSLEYVMPRTPSVTMEMCQLDLRAGEHRSASRKTVSSRPLLHQYPVKQLISNDVGCATAL